MTSATWLLIAVGVLTSPSSAAQAPAPADDGKREFTIAGCLLRNGYAGYQIEDATLDAIDGKTIAKAADRSDPKSAAASAPRKWILEGGGNLGPRTGEKVQVIGRSDWKPGESPGDEPPNRTPRLDVKSVKTIAPTC
jgi:hypothetical protein